MTTPEELVALGFRIFPVYGVETEAESGAGWCQCEARVSCPDAGKHPRIRNWPEEATNDLAKIRRWEKAYPGTNWGIATDGLVVMDVDPRNNGFASYYWLEKQDLAPWPETLTVRSGGGGTHEIYRAPNDDEVSSGRLLEGIDVKAKGGYVIAPGSRHASGRMYEIIKNVPIAPAPGWLRPNRKSSSGGLLDLVEGQRHESFLQRAAYLRNAGLEEPEILAGLLALNERTNPPLPADEIELIAQGYGGYESRWDTIAQQLETKANKNEALENDGPWLSTSVDRAGRKPPVWRVDGLIPETGVGQIYGPTYSGKTFVALDLALSMANQDVPSWMGQFDIASHGPVVYILMEGAFGFTQRIKAWTAHHGKSDELLYTIEEKAVDLMDDAVTGKIKTELVSLPDKPVLVVVDTQALATPGLEENSNTDMNRLYLGLKQWSRTLGCPVLMVHHTGHERGRARGASAQKAALDFEIEVETREEGTREIHVTKVKEAEPAKPWTFSLQPSDGSVVAVPGAPVTKLRDGDQRIADEMSATQWVQNTLRTDGPTHWTSLRDRWTKDTGRDWPSSFANAGRPAKVKKGGDGIWSMD